MSSTTTAVTIDQADLEAMTARILEAAKSVRNKERNEKRKRSKQEKQQQGQGEGNAPKKQKTGTTTTKVVPPPQYVHWSPTKGMRVQTHQQFVQQLDKRSDMTIAHSDRFWGLTNELANVASKPSVAPATVIFRQLVGVYPKHAALQKGERTWGSDETYCDLMALATLLEAVKHPNDYDDKVGEFVHSYSALELAHMYLRRDTGLRSRLIRYWSSHLHADQAKLIEDDPAGEGKQQQQRSETGGKSLPPQKINPDPYIKTLKAVLDKNGTVVNSEKQGGIAVPEKWQEEWVDPDQIPYRQDMFRKPTVITDEDMENAEREADKFLKEKERGERKEVLESRGIYARQFVPAIKPDDFTGQKEGEEETKKSDGTKVVKPIEQYFVPKYAKGTQVLEATIPIDQEEEDKEVREILEKQGETELDMKEVHHVAQELKEELEKEEKEEGELTESQQEFSKAIDELTTLADKVDVVHTPIVTSSKTPSDEQQHE